MSKYTLASGSIAKVKRQDIFTSPRHGLVYVYYVENVTRPFLFCEAWVYASGKRNSSVESHGDIDLDAKEVIEAAEMHHTAIA